MFKRVNFSYFTLLFLSILLYAIPFYLGKQFLPFVLGLFIFLLILFVSQHIRKNIAKGERLPLALLLINGLVSLHFLLLFSVLVLQANVRWTLSIGTFFGLLIFYIVNRRLPEHL